MGITVNKDAEEIYYLEVSNKELPYKFIFKSPYVVPFFKYMRGYTWLTWMMPVVKSPFEVTFEIHPVEKTMMVTTNIDTQENVVKVSQLGGDKYNIEWNSEPVAEFVAAARKVEVVKVLEDGTKLKTTITWTGLDFFENTATVTMLYKDIPQVATFGWNFQNSDQMTFNFDIIGKKVPFFGDFEFVWDGTATSNMIKTLATPIKTDARITVNEGDLQVMVEKTFNSKTFTLIFNTKPFKIAFLPYFEV